MSNLKQFTSRIENPSTGEIILGTQSDEAFYVSEGYIECDGSIVSRNAYPTLSQNVDFFQDNLGVSATIISSGTSNTILDMVYANNQFVYLDANNVIGTSSNGVSWSRTSLNISLELEYVGGKTFDRLGNTSTTSVSLTDLTGGVSSSPSEGDVVFVAVATGSIANRSQAVSGYTQIASLYANDTIDTNLWVGYKVMGVTPDTTITIPSTGSLDDAQTVAIQVWRNVDSAIFDVTSTTSTIIDTARVNPPSITTVSANTVLLVIGAGGHDEASVTYTASYLSNFLTTGASDTYDSSIGFGSIFRPTAGAYDPAIWTFNDPDDGRFSNASVTIALRRNSPTFNTLLFENGNYFLGAPNGAFARSSNAISWTASNLGGTIRSSTFANNTYVLAGNSGFLVTSSNAITWTTRTSGTSQDIVGLSNDNNGTFVYVTESGFVSTSSNAFTWSTPTNITQFNPDSFYVGGKTSSRAGSTSTTNVSLTDLTGGLASSPSEGDVVFVAVATGSIANRSQAVAGYTQIATLYSNSSINDTNLWVGYKIMTSTPDTTITIPSTGSVDDAQTVAIQVWRNVDSSLFGAEATTFSNTSSVIVNPSAITPNAWDEFQAILVFGAGAHSAGTQTFTASYLSDFLTVGANDLYDSTIGSGYVAYSSGTYDPAAWTFSAADDVSGHFSSAAVTIALRLNNTPKKLSYGNGLFVVSGTAGQIYTSPNGVTWTSRVSGTTQNINDVLTYNTTLYVGNGGVFATSPNNITWTARTSGTSNNLNTIAYGNGTFVLAGTNGTIATYEPYTYNYRSEFKLPTVNTTITQSQKITAYIKT